MSAHHYIAWRYELPLEMYVSESVHRLVKRGAALFATLARWQEDRLAVEQLSVLDDHLLRDIGIDNRNMIGDYVRKGRR